MNNSARKYRCLVFFIITLLRLNLSGQLLPDVASQVIEKLFLITDRKTYCVDENISFTALNTSPKYHKNIEWSKVLYVELISHNGSSLAKQKFILNEYSCVGNFHIPESISSGMYYLKAYTKWMRNFSTKNYSYTPIKIVNPQVTELSPFTSNGSHEWNYSIKKLETNDDIIIDVKEEDHNSRVKVEFQIENNLYYPTTASIAVVQKDLFKNEYYSFGFETKSDSLYTYLPETRGISISGEIINDNDTNGLSFSPVHATVFNRFTQNFSALSNEKGKFYISFNEMKGVHEVFITTRSNSQNKPTILIDNDFCSKPVSLPQLDFSLTEEEKTIINQISLNQQITKYFADNNTDNSAYDTLFKLPFYGIPDYEVVFKDFITLPTLQDYIHELMPNVSVRQKNKQRYLKILGESTEMSLFEPLVLIDLIPVFDIERLLSASPKNIDRAEIIIEPYIVGSQIYGGVVSFFSKKGDFAGVELPSWGNFLKFKMYSKNQYNCVIPTNDIRTPDNRTCLLLESIQLQRKEKKLLSFQTSDIHGDFIIFVIGVNDSGELLYNSKTIKVK